MADRSPNENPFAPPDTRFNVYWGTTYPGGEKSPELIASDLTYDNAMKVMSRDREKRFPQLGYYTRLWEAIPDVIQIDYGSWMFFYFLVPVDYTTPLETIPVG